MTRKWFLSLLGISVAGQQIKETHPIYTIQQQDIDRMAPGGLLRPKPRNGECPACGMMAPAYKRKMVGFGLMSDCEPVKSERKDGTKIWAGAVRCKEAKDWDGPATRTITCSHCRVWFDQDAEKPE